MCGKMLLFCQSKPIAFFCPFSLLPPSSLLKHSTWPRRPEKTPYRDRWCRMSTMQAKLTYQAQFPISPHAKEKRKENWYGPRARSIFFARSLFFSLMTENKEQSSLGEAPWRQKGSSTLKPGERHFLRPWHALSSFSSSYCFMLCF